MSTSTITMVTAKMWLSRMMTKMSDNDNDNGVVENKENVHVAQLVFAIPDAILILIDKI